ncbi:MAG: MtnX-like HAD-IB family phosphatase [Terriglobia bacterium]
MKALPLDFDPPATLDPVVFCDFDGTITRADVTDAILTRLAGPEWKEIENVWMAGQIGSQECLRRQMALVRASKSDLDRLIDSIPLDPHFRQFARYARATSLPFIVVSDGMDHVIRRILVKSGLWRRPRNGSDFFSSSARLKDGGINISFPHGRQGCVHGCATCKPWLMKKLKRDRWPVLYIGDGFSDRHAVFEADFVYARRPLFDFCRERGIPCRVFDTFAEIEGALARWRDGGAVIEMSEAAIRARSSERVLVPEAGAPRT